MAVQTLIQVRRGTATEWTAVNSPNGPTLSAGEIGFDTTNKRIKIGDGTTAWASLDYIGSSEEQIQDVVGTLISGASGISVDYQDSNGLLYINVSGIASSQINDFNSAVDARVTAASVSAEEVMDIVGGANGLYGGSGINIDYQDGNDKLHISVTGIGLSEVTDVTASAAEVNVLDGVTAGTVSASKGLVADSNKDITGLRNLSIEGDLTINGTTTTVNSTTTTIEDPIIILGSGSPGSDDNKDRGISFNYYDGSAKVGFFGYDDSLGKMIFVPDASISSEVVTGSSGTIVANLQGNADTVTNGVYTTDTGSVTSLMIANDTIVNADVKTNAAIDVTKLAASGLTIGSTVINLSNTSTVLDGLTRISGASAGSPTYIYNAVLDGGSP